MSLLVFTGASQFSAVTVIGDGGSPVAAFSSGMLLAARHTVYGLALSRVLRGSLLTRMVAAHLVIDETTAIATAQGDPRAQRAAFWTTGLVLFAFWNLATLVGALAGEAMDPKTFG